MQSSEKKYDSMKTKDIVKLIRGIKAYDADVPFTFYASYHPKWACGEERDWEIMENLISQIGFTCKNWRIYALYDLDGCYYWETERVPNFIQVVLEIYKETVSQDAAKAIRYAWIEAMDNAIEISKNKINLL